MENGAFKSNTQLLVKRLVAGQGLGQIGPPLTGGLVGMNLADERQAREAFAMTIGFEHEVGTRLLSSAR